MFDLAKCQNRIKFAEFFGEWFKQKLQSGELDDMLFRPAYLTVDFIDRAKHYGFQFINREIACSNFVSTIFALPYEDKGKIMQKICRFEIFPTDTKRSICWAFIDRTDIITWTCKQQVVNKFIEQMKGLPGYCKTFDDIEEN